MAGGAASLSQGRRLEGLHSGSSCSWKVLPQAGGKGRAARTTCSAKPGSEGRVPAAFHQLNACLEKATSMPAQG